MVLKSPISAQYMNKVILFYKYVFIENPGTISAEQKQLCQSLALKGRLILSAEGINGCLAGQKQAVQAYQEHMNSHALFDQIDFKESEGDDFCFARLKVMVKKEIVNLGLDPEKVTARDAATHLEPSQAHKLIAQQPDDLLILDCRNEYESRIGTFVGAVEPKTRYFRELPTYIDENLEQFKDKQVLMYCTGGIRCERASAYLKQKNVARSVYQIKGGIHRYVNQFPDGFFRGKNYVFDGRIALKVTDDVLSYCFLCSAPCDDYNNCLNARCNKHFICCAACLAQYKSTCSKNCLELTQNNLVPLRSAFQKAKAVAGE